MSPDKNQSGFLVSVALAAVLGAAVIVGSLALEHWSATADADVPLAATPEFGQRLLRDTALYLGPDQVDPDKRFTGSRMACASCHLDTGMQPGTLSLLPTSTRYPRFSGRDGGIGDLRDRINGCMQRSMNGRPLPRGSVEMIAMEAYIVNLGQQFAAMGASRRASTEQAAFTEPERAANPAAGALVYEQRCTQCHGEDGLGLRASLNPSDGFVFPPLWGPDSFNNGAGMNRVLTASRFIKARMPFGEADLSDDEAFDVAAYINSQPRPQMTELENDYPDRTNKPIDSPYPPYADPFTQEQHKYGPFEPIREYYERLEAQSNETAGSAAR